MTQVRALTRLLPVGRLWLRGSRRRPGRAATVVLGVALMSATTVGALVGGDVLEALFLADAEGEWGAVDLEVRADDNAVHDLSTGRLVGVEGAPVIVGTAPRLILQSAISAGDAIEPGVQLLGLGAEEQDFPPLEAVEGSADFLRLAPDEVIVNQRLAERLSVGAGDRVRVVAAVPRWLEDVRGQIDPIVHHPFAATLDLVVAGVAADSGVADLHRTPNAIVRRDALGLATGLENRVTVTHLRVADPGRDGAEAGVDALAHLVAPFELDIETVKQDAIDLADEDGGLFRSILLTLSFLVVGAAIVAVRGLLLTLAEERGAELAVLRALGARRAVAGALLRMEAAAYGIVGALLGGLAGIPLGTRMAELLVDHFATLNAGRGREQVTIPAEVDPATVVTGIVLVALVAVLTGGSAAKLALATPTNEVLRGGSLTGGHPRPTGRRVVLTTGIGALTLGMGVSGGPLLYIGLTILLGGWWMAVRGRPGADVGAVDRRAAWWGLAWSVLGAAALTDAGAGVQSAFGVLIVGGASAIFCAAVLLRTRLRSSMRLIRTWVPLGPAQSALIIAGARAERERRRSTTTMLTLGAVLFMIAALSVLGSAQALPVERQAGGFDVIARSVATLQTRDWQDVPGVSAVGRLSESWLPQTAYTVQARGGPPLTVPYPVRVAAPTAQLASVQAFGLAAAVDGIESAAQALAMVSTAQGAAVVDRAALPEGAKVGDDVVIDGGVAPRRLRLIAVLDTYLLSSVIVHEGDLAAVAELRGPTTALIRVEDGADPAQVVAALEATLASAGVTADTVERVRADVIAVNQTFTDVFALLLLLGLVVAVASVAAYVVRAARERRRHLSVARALGMRTGAVTLSLAAEPALAAVVGTALGLTVGLGLLRVLFALGFSDLAFVVNWGRVAVVSAGSLGLLILACGIAAVVSLPRDVAAGLRDLG